MKPVNHYLRKITGPIYKKYGFSREEILEKWEIIVGAQFAQVTAPEKIIWPTRRTTSNDAAAQNSHFSRAAQGATLRVRVEPHAALDIEYQTNFILERINSFFGYRAVTRLTLIQGPVIQSVSQEPAPATPCAPATPPPAGFTDPELAAALQKLGTALHQKKK